MEGEGNQMSDLTLLTLGLGKKKLNCPLQLIDPFSMAVDSA